MERSESFLDTFGPCGVFWSSINRCPLRRARLYDGGHVCSEPGAHSRETGHACKCGERWAPK